MNTQVCIGALRAIRAALPQAIQAGDLQTVRWVADMMEEVEQLAREIRKNAQQGITQLQTQGATEEGASTR